MDDIFENEYTDSIEAEDIDAAEEKSIMKQKVSQRRRNTFLKRNRLLHLSKINPYNPRIYPYEREVWEKDDWKCINRPYAVRSHNSNRSKFAKRRSNKLVRRYNGTFVGSKYKRMYDFCWEVY